MEENLNNQLKQPEKQTVVVKEEQKKKKDLPQKKAKQTNIDFDEDKDYETDEAFNIEEYENRILEELKLKINTSKDFGYKMMFYSISYKDMILFNLSTVTEAVENAVGFKSNSKELTMYFIREYRKRGDIGFVDIANNYITSKFYIEFNGKTIDFDAVPIFARVFDMNENDLYQLKLSDDNTKDARVLTSSEVEK
jgi:hypothetical protein